MTRTKRYVRFLSFDDVIDMQIAKHGGRIIAFALNYRVHVGGRWREVVRYDNAHGRAHVHRFWHGPESRPWPGPAVADVGEAYEWAKGDLGTRRREYRTRLEASL
jgi:hypothetical protein